MKKIGKKNLITILLVAIPVIGLIAAGLFLYFRKRKNKSAIGRDSVSLPSEKNVLSEENLFSDPSTYLENAKQYPSKWKKFIRNLIKEAYKVGDNSIKEPELKEAWYNAVEYWLREVNLKQNKPKFGIEDWIAGYTDTPLAAIVSSILYDWQKSYNNGSNKKIISKKEAKDMIEKAGGDPHANWIAKFPENPVLNDQTTSQQQQTQNAN